MRKCKGCGAVLQNTDSQALGYVPDLTMEYCQRCFRLTHYDRQQDYIDLTVTQDLSLLEDLKGIFVWIVDVIDLETSLLSVIPQFLKTRRFIMVVNKCDLLPATVKENKIRKYIGLRLKELGLQSEAVIIRGRESSFRDKMIEIIRNSDEEFIFMGIANVGKSTVINDLLNQQLLTVNRNPSTTLALNRIETEYGTLIDSVGLVAKESIQAYLASNTLKQVVPYAPINPLIYQLRSSQSIAIGGLARIDLLDCEGLTCVVYCSNLLSVNRGKQVNRDQLWKRHYGRELSPVVKGAGGLGQMKKTTFEYREGKLDICIAGLGWICVSGKFSRIDVYSAPQIGVHERKVLI